MPEQIPLNDPRFKGKRYEITLPPEHPRFNQRSAEECAEKITEVESLMKSFESIYNLEELHAITEFATREDRINSPRHAALEALGPILKQLEYLGSQEAVAQDIYDAMFARFNTLKRAVGATRDDPAGVLYGIVAHDI